MIQLSFLIVEICHFMDFVAKSIFGRIIKKYIFICRHTQRISHKPTLRLCIKLLLWCQWYQLCKALVAWIDPVAMCVGVQDGPAKFRRTDALEITYHLQFLLARQIVTDVVIVDGGTVIGSLLRFLHQQRDGDRGTRALSKDIIFFFKSY